MTPQVGQNVQYFEHPGAKPQAAIVVAVRPNDRLDLAVWPSVSTDGQCHWDIEYSITVFNPNIRRPGWQFIPTTVRTEYPFKEGPFPPGPITVQTPPDDRSCSQSPFDPH